MKKKDAVVGLRVAVKVTQYYEGDEPRGGTIVTGPAAPGYVRVDWDQYDYMKKMGQPSIIEEVALKDLLPLQEANAQFSKLEKEFKAYEKQVLAKMKEAGKLIKEANKLAQKAGVESLNEMYNATHPLFNAMEETGWNTSSLGC
jgi:hypothetical protein